MRLCAAEGCNVDLTDSHATRRWCSERCRRTQYAGTCAQCGAATNGHNGPGTASDTCIACFESRNEERNERIFAAWENGETAKQIAAREGMTDTDVGSLVDHHRRKKGRALTLHRRRDRELWPLIERRWNEGATASAIAREAGTTDQNIAFMVQQMRRLGFDLPRRDLSIQIDIAEAAAKYRAGWSCARIAAGVGCSPTSIWRALQRAGVELRPQKGGRQKVAA